MFVEEVLAEMEEKQNVLVMLQSVNIWAYDENRNPLILQDSCGNHYASTWLETIKEFHLEGRFSVLTKYTEDDQVTLNIDAKKGDTGVKTLDRESNNIACNRAIEYSWNY